MKPRKKDKARDGVSERPWRPFHLKPCQLPHCKLLFAFWEISWIVRCCYYDHHKQNNDAFGQCGVLDSIVSIGGFHCAGIQFRQFAWQREVSHNQLLLSYKYSPGGIKSLRQCYSKKIEGKLYLPKGIAWKNITSCYTIWCLFHQPAPCNNQEIIVSWCSVEYI